MLEALAILSVLAAMAAARTGLSDEELRALRLSTKRTGRTPLWMSTDLVHQYRIEPGSYEERVRHPGEEALFEYHCFESMESGDAGLWLRSHQPVVVLEVLSDPDDDRDSILDRGGRTYKIRFRDGFEGVATWDELLNARDQYERPDPPSLPDNMKLYFRGTQSNRPTVRGVASYTPSLPVALIWAATPGDVWSSRDPAWSSTAEVSAGHLKIDKVLDLGSTSLSLDDLLRKLNFQKEGGISEDEVVKIYNYLHNRLTGKARGGVFSYQVHDEDGDLIDESDMPFSLFSPQTPIISAKEDFLWNGPEAASRLRADTFVFADAPAVQRAARRLGFDAIAYEDVFEGGVSASPILLGTPVDALDGVSMKRDMNGRLVPVHRTIRPLDPGLFEPVWTRGAQEVLQQIQPMHPPSLPSARR